MSRTPLRDGTDRPPGTQAVQPGRWPAAGRRRRGRCLPGVAAAGGTPSQRGGREAGWQHGLAAQGQVVAVASTAVHGFQGHPMLITLIGREAGEQLRVRHRHPRTDARAKVRMFLGTSCGPYLCTCIQASWQGSVRSIERYQAQTVATGHNQ